MGILGPYFEDKPKVVDLPQQLRHLKRDWPLHSWVTGENTEIDYSALLNYIPYALRLKPRGYKPRNVDIYISGREGLASGLNLDIIQRRGNEELEAGEMHFGWEPILDEQEGVVILSWGQGASNPKGKYDKTGVRVAGANWFDRTLWRVSGGDALILLVSDYEHKRGFRAIEDFSRNIPVEVTEGQPTTPARRLLVVQPSLVLPAVAR